MKRPNCVGILGGGQLGRMLALAGYPLGLTCLVLDPQFDACAGQVTPHLVHRYDEEPALQLFAGSVGVATYEFENVPARAAASVAQAVPLYPSLRSLEVAGDRLQEKRLLQKLAIRTAEWAPVSSEAELARAGKVLGYPLLLKTRRSGYDGKGQALVRDAGELRGAWRSLRCVPCVAERVVRFHRELSLLAVRGIRGEVAFYPLVQNCHEGGILRLTLAPAPGVVPALQAAAEAYAGRLLSELDYVGVLALELFECADGLLANELAPRVHNSGHWTIEGAVTSQFENHLRAITGMPLGPALPVGCSAMLNLIGTAPPGRSLDGIPGAHLHLYGKLAAPGRKLGHVTVTAADGPELEHRLARVRSCLDRHGIRAGPCLNDSHPIASQSCNPLE